MPIGIGELQTLSSAITPSDEVILERSRNWNKLFEKYSIHQTDDDGVDWEDFDKLKIGNKTESDDFVICDDSDEAVEDADCFEAEDNSRDLEHLNPEEKLSHHFTPELLNELKKVFAQRAAELGKLNLPYWNYERHETTKSESVVNTPNGTMTSRSLKSCHQKMSSTTNFQQKAVDRININGNEHIGSDITSTIASLLAIGAGFTMKVREREYDINVNGGDTGSKASKYDKKTKGTNAPRTVISGPTAANSFIPLDELKRLVGSRNLTTKDAQFKQPQGKVSQPVEKSFPKTGKKAEKKEKSKQDKPYGKSNMTASCSQASAMSDESSASTETANTKSKAKYGPRYQINSAAAHLEKPKQLDVTQPRTTIKNVRVLNSIIISDSDESDDEFYLDRTSAAKKPLENHVAEPAHNEVSNHSPSDESDDDFYLAGTSVAKKPLDKPVIKPAKNRVSNHSSSSDSDDVLLSVKHSKSEKVLKKVANTNEDHSPKKIRKIK